MMLESFTLASETDEAVFRVSNDPLMTMSCYSENIYPFGIFPQKKLRHLEFDDITIFCGGNGSGKSTLLNLIARKIGLGHASPYNDTPFFEKYLSLCSYTPRHPPAAPEGSCVVTSDDVFESLLKARRRNENTGRLRDELFQRYTKLKDNPDGFDGFRSLEDIDILKEHNEAVRMTRSRFISGRMTPEDPLRSNGESAFAIFTERIRENALYLLDEPIGADREGNEIHLTDLLGTDKDAVSDAAETSIESGRALRLIDTPLLSERERRVVQMRYGLLDGAPRPQHEVARALGISRSYVSRIEKRALDKLRHALGG